MTNRHHHALSTNASTDHLLAVVEPAGAGDTTLALANDVVARGGQATVLMLITDRVAEDIRSFAAAEDLDYSMAELHAIERLTSYCSGRIGADVPTHVARLGRRRIDLRHHITGHLTDRITAVALPACLTEQDLGRLATTLDRPVVIMPDQAA